MHKYPKLGHPCETAPPDRVYRPCRGTVFCALPEAAAGHPGRGGDAIGVRRDLPLQRVGPGSTRGRPACGPGQPGRGRGVPRACVQRWLGRGGQPAQEKDLWLPGCSRPAGGPPVGTRRCRRLCPHHPQGLQLQRHSRLGSRRRQAGGVHLGRQQLRNRAHCQGVRPGARPRSQRNPQ